MKRIILTSAGFENKKIEDIFLNFIDKSADTAKALWIPTAAIDDDAKAVLPKCMNDLLNAGLKKENITVYDLDYKMNYEELKNYDVVYVCGGDCNHLIKRMRKVGFIDLIMKYSENDGVYVGVSAGSCICGSDFKKGIPWIPCKIDVHCSKGTPKGEYDFEQFKMVKLTDKQAIVLYGNTIQIAE